MKSKSNLTKQGEARTSRQSSNSIDCGALHVKTDTKTHQHTHTYSYSYSSLQYHIALAQQLYSSTAATCLPP
jgi:hypothetical protein